FRAAAAAHRLGVVVDVVPNHTGVADAHENPAWWDVLKLGRGSAFARWFDIDWSAGRIRLPVLGDDFRDDQLQIDDGELRYFEHAFPLAAQTATDRWTTGADAHRGQHYELIGWRRADTDQNYRRFFAITSLAGLRVEDPAVFDATHREIARWVRSEGVTGLRVDHPDGLADPLGYLTRLRALAGPQAWLLVEKILEPGEQLPADWPVDGTTGYDALAEVGGVFVDTAAEDRFDALYRELTGDHRSSGEHVRDGKRAVLETILQAEVRRIARLAPDVPDAVAALVELAVAFPVYRSYLPTGAEDLDDAIDTAQTVRPDLAAAIGALAERLRDPGDEVCVRFQQLTGATMAKGVEDTAFYRYSRFVALNEVGADPGRFGLRPDEFHAAQRHRQRVAPRGMTTLTTHDTKRGEDVRTRLAVLAELPDEWAALARTLMTAAPVPDRPLGYLLWQTFAGTGFIARDRMHRYAEKAMREAAESTTWADPDPAFEAAVHAAVDAAYDSPAVHDPLAAFIERITSYGWANSLGQKLMQLTMPGVPDVYQGTEVFTDSLVDPDNRQPVDFARLTSLLRELDAAAAPPPVDASGAAKLWVTSRALRLRRDRPELFAGYTEVPVTGAAGEHAVAFDRGGAVTVATRLPVRLARDGGWRDTALDLAGEHTDVLTGRMFAGDVALAELLSTYPVALLVR
ncbi:MAG TPA: malto-oligosyltrehalose synthase, partial [Jatrophihabitans sp.]|nr:malto-oligosyltrehalose synthase [Jatrophihabitans sp.]